MNPTEGYRRARTILKEQFGNQFEIAQAWIDKVTQETIVKTSELRKFANILRTCYETLKALLGRNRSTEQFKENRRKTDLA